MWSFPLPLPGGKNGKKRKKQVPSTQEGLVIEALHDDTAFLEGGTMVRIMEVGAVDMDLMDPGRRTYLIARFREFITHLKFPIQIAAASRPQDIAPWLDRLEAIQEQWERWTFPLPGTGAKHASGEMSSRLDEAGRVEGGVAVQEPTPSPLPGTGGQGQVAKRLAQRLQAQIDFIRQAHSATIPKGQAYYIAIPFKSAAKLSLSGGDENGKGRGLEQAMEELHRRQEQIGWGLQDIGLPYKALSSEEIGEIIFRFYHSQYEETSPPERMLLATEDWEWEQGGTKRVAACEAGPLTLQDKLAPALQKLYMDHFQFSDTHWGRIYYIWNYPRNFSRGALRRLLDFPGKLHLAMFVSPMAPQEAHQALKKMRVSMAAEEIHDTKEGKLPSPGGRAKLTAAEGELTRMEVGGEDLYWLCFYLGLFAESKEQLEAQSRELEDRLLRADLTFHRAGGLQERGINSILPLGADQMHQRRNMNAQGLAGFFPFVRKTYLEPRGLPYGIHRQNGTWVVLDDFGELSNPNSLIIGKPGMGKSVFLKHKMEHAVLTGQRVYALDLEGEFKLLCEDLGGIYLDMGGNSSYKMNVLDLNPEDDRPLHAGLSTFLGWLEIAVGRRLTPMERNVIVPTAYERAMKEAGIQTGAPSTWGRTPPRLSDIAGILRTDERREAKDLAACLHPYALGLYADDFNCHTNVDVTENPLVVFGLKGVERNMVPVRMFQVEAFIRARVLRGKKSPTHVMVDEAWHMLSRPGTAEALAEMSRRFRKNYAGLDLSTQQAQDFATSKDAQIVRDNAATALLFAQNEPAAKALGALFELNNTEAAMLPTLRKGEALLLREGTHIPIYVPIPPERYSLYTTNPRDKEFYNLTPGGAGVGSGTRGWREGITNRGS